MEGKAFGKQSIRSVGGRDHRTGAISVRVYLDATAFQRLKKRAEFHDNSISATVRQDVEDMNRIKRVRFD